MTTSSSSRSFTFFPKLVFAISLAASAGAVSAIDAGRVQLLPFVIDGDGIRTRLIVTNVSESSSHCSFDLSGPSLDFGRFEDHFLVTVEDERATFELEEDGGQLIWTSKGQQTLTYGYARLDCAEPVAAQVLFTTGLAGELVSMTSISGNRKADEFQFALIPRIGSLAFVLANDENPDASCDVILRSPYGSDLSEEAVPVPEMAPVFHFVDELFRIPEDYTEGTVFVSCDRKVAATGFSLFDGKFSAIPPAIFTPAPEPPAPEPEPPVQPLEPEPEPEPVVQPPEPEPEPEPEPIVQPPEPEPEPEPPEPDPPQAPAPLTMTGMTVNPQPSGNGRYFLDIQTEPRDASLTNISTHINPFGAGEFYGASLRLKYLWFRCSESFSGSAGGSIQTWAGDQRITGHFSVSC